MVRDLLHGPPLESFHADVCVVGAGAAGITLAVELLRLGRTVLLLEGGGGAIEDDSQEPGRGSTSGFPYAGLHAGRVRAAGGTTTRWGGQILELDRRDFLHRDRVAGSGWPFPRQHLQPFYDRALELEGLRRATADDAAVWHQLGLHPLTLPHFEPFFSRWCPEPNFARLHARTLAEHPALTVWLHANAVDLACEGPRLRSVRCRSLSGTEAVFSADRFVFCLGGIESSRFFLQPRPAQAPWLRSGLLGRFFQDHISSVAATLVPHHSPTFHRVFDNAFSRGFKYQPRLRLAPADQDAFDTLNAAASINFVSRSGPALDRLKRTGRHLLHRRWQEVHAADLLHALRHTSLLARAAFHYRVNQRIYNPGQTRVELLVDCEQEPESQSRITLSSDRDSLGLLRTHLDWRVSDRELHTLATVVRLAQTALAPFARVHPHPDLLSPTHFPAHAQDAYHHMGGMRMSTSPALGLVDPDLLLHGMQNAFICSSAVFPSSGFANPTHTLLALALRLARHLA